MFKPIALLKECLEIDALVCGGRLFHSLVVLGKKEFKLDCSLVGGGIKLDLFLRL
jgi:hypothetical protein